MRIINKILDNIALLLVVFLVCDIIILLLTAFLTLPKWADAINSVVTLGLAFAAFLTIRQNITFRQKDKKQRIINEIIEWVSDLKLSITRIEIPQNPLTRELEYEVIFSNISDSILKAEIMKLRASENSLPIIKEINMLWQSTFYCAQLAARIAGHRPTTGQKKRWDKPALDIIDEIDQLEKRDRLVDEEVYIGQRKILGDITHCFEALAKIEADL